MDSAEADRLAKLDAYAFFGYEPNKPAAIIALLIFLVLGVICLVLSLKTRAYFMLLVSATAFFEVVGYGARVAAIGNPSSNNIIIMQLFLIITPTLLAVACYMTVGRILVLSGTQRTGCLRASWISKIFGASDAITLTIQCAGGGFLGVAPTHPEMYNTGMAIEIIGLVAQVAFFSIFAFVAVWLYKAPSLSVSKIPGARRLFGSLFATIGVLTVRNVYRMVEFAQGMHGDLATHEVYFYVFDALLVSLAVAIMTAFHPGFLFARLRGQPAGPVRLEAGPAKAPAGGPWVPAELRTLAIRPADSRPPSVDV